jgi:NTP pyrophosphatase (non-canonical NTP hydrolase)
MALSDYQKQVDDWVESVGGGYWKPHEMLARATEEMGELARLINHMYGPKKKKASEPEQEMGEEIADIIWALACIANSHGINLDESFKSVVNKAYKRDSGRFEHQGESRA